MFVIYNIESGCVKVATTEEPTQGLALKDGWDIEHAIASFPDVDVTTKYESFLQVINGELIDHGTVSELEGSSILLQECSKVAPDLFE